MDDGDKKSENNSVADYEEAESVSSEKIGIFF